jgi:hypothetical protein
VQVDGIAALYEHCQARQVVHPDGGLREQPWGTREFIILDPTATPSPSSRAGGRP